MTRLEETREALMDALGEWWELAHVGRGSVLVDEQLIDAYAAYQRAMNGEAEDDD